MNDDLIMEEIRKHQCIYNKNHGAFMSKDAKEQAWLEIAEALGSSVHSLQNKYHMIRSKFSRQLKKVRLTHPDVAIDALPLPLSVNKWRWLTPYVFHRFTHDDQKEDSQSSDNEGLVINVERKRQIQEQETPPKMPKLEYEVPATVAASNVNLERSYITEGSSSRVSDDQIDSYDSSYHFCMSIVPRMRSLTVDQRELAQIEILQILRKIRLTRSISYSEMNPAIIELNHDL